MNNGSNSESLAKILVMMPFNQEFDDVYDNIKRATKEAVAGETFLCYRLDDIKSAGKVTDDLVSEIERSPLCIADLTRKNPNVLWEVGYAMALKKPVILIAQSLKRTPFNIKDYRMLSYDRNNLAELRQRLSEAIKETIAKYQLRVEAITIKAPKKEKFTVAVTGSSLADPDSCRRSVESILKPYLDSDTIFYVGGGGSADEAAAEYLGSMKQEVIVVGHHPLDMTEKMLQIAKKYNFLFVDSTKEGLPKDMGISERNLFFATKSNLLIILSDGRPLSYTQNTIDWCRSHRKDHIEAFVSVRVRR